MEIETVNEQDEALEHLEQKAVAQPSLRESLADAVEQSKAKEDVVKETKSKIERTRNEDGKFIKEAKKVSHETAVSEIKEPAPISMPKSFKPEMAKDFATLPRHIQEIVAKREEDFHKELTKHDEERVFGRQINQIVTPYMAQIRAEGADAPKAIAELLNTAHLLRTGTPQQKGELLWRTAQTFGADMRQGLQQQAQNQVNPQLQGLQQTVDGLKQQIERDAVFKKQQEDDALQSQINTFAADPKNVHFEAVKAHMATLLRGGVAKDLQDAYDQAVYANPQTRSTLLMAQNTEAEEKRVADKKAKAEAAKRAGSSIKGAPGIAALKNGKITQPDLRSEIRAAMSAYAEG